MHKVIAAGTLRATFAAWIDAHDWAQMKVNASTLPAYYVHDAETGDVTKVERKIAEKRVVAALYECEEGSDDPRAIQGGGGASEHLYKIIRGTRARIEAYCRAHSNRYGEELLVRYRP